MRRIFAVSFIIVTIIISTGVLMFGIRVGHADNNPTGTPTPVAGAFTSGMWKGQGSFATGLSGFDMTLTLTVTNNTFSGDLTEPTLDSEATIDGSVSSFLGNDLGLTFVPSKIIKGDQILLNSIYTATFSNGRIRGIWSIKGNSTPEGNFTLDPFTPPTPTASPTQPQAPIQPPSPTPIPTQPSVPTPTQPVTNTSPYVLSGNGQQANVSTVVSWYGFDDNSGQTEGQHGSAAISHPRNTGNPTLHNQATEGSGTFNDPITFANRVNDQQTFPVGSVVYVPLTRKYYIVEDTCGDTNTQGCLNGTHHIDLWMGPPNASGNALLNCENNNTPAGPVQVIINPSSSLPVETTPEFSNGQCTLRTF